MKKDRPEMSGQTKMVIYAMFLSIPRIAAQVEPVASLSRGNGRNKEFLMNRKQLVDYADRVFRTILEKL